MVETFYCGINDNQMEPSPLNYYQYTADDQFYYFCIEDSTTTFDFPSDAIIFDPSTLECIYAPGQPIPSYAAKEPTDVPQTDRGSPQIEPKQEPIPATAAKQQPKETPKPEIGQETARKNSNVKPKVVSTPEAAKPSCPTKSEDPSKPAQKASSSTEHAHEPAVAKPKKAVVVETFNKSGLQGMIQRFNAVDFAIRNFKEHKTGWFLNKKVVPPSELLKFSPEPLSSPLLRHIPKKLCKEAVTCFELILCYTGVKKSKNKPQKNLASLSKLLLQFEDLVDEVYFQLVKQTTSNSDANCLLKTWELFLVICTLFPASTNSAATISAHIASTLTQTTNPEIRKYSELAFIRFETRCHIGKAQNPSNMQEIILSPNETSDCFGISIMECLWVQRNPVNSSKFPKEKKALYYPKCQVPYVLHAMTKAIISKGGKTMEGIFRIPGNSKKVESAIEQINRNLDYVNSMDLNDVASLFKRWWADLPVKIVPPTKTEEMAHILGEEEPDFGKALDILVPLDRVTFLYLIGFLREMAEGQEKTLMGPSNLALVFAPNLYTMPNDMNLGKQMNASFQKFIVYLIDKADISGIYPLENPM